MTKNLTARELFPFCEQLSILLHSGISAAESLRLLCEDSSSEKSREILSAMLESLEETGCLYLAMEASGLFPASMTAYVRAGEETGCLDEVMESLSVHYEQEIEISKQIRSAITYPLLMLGMMGAVIIILLVKVLPVFQQVFRQMGMEMNGISGRLLDVGSTLGRNSTVFLVIAAIFTGAVIFLCFHQKGQAFLRKAASRLPVIREIPVALDYARMTHGIALGLRSGLGPESSMELARGLVSHPLVSGRLKEADRLMTEGELFSKALIDSELFGGMDARLIAIGFHSGAGDEVMEKLSGRCRDTSLELVSKTVSVVEPVIVIVLSLLVGLVLLSVMMPLLGILSEMII